MASMARGGKPVRLGAQNWTSFSGVCLIGLLLAIVSISHLVGRGGKDTAFSSGGVAIFKYRGNARLSDINCDDEIGAVRKNIPAAQQYHPVVAPNPESFPGQQEEACTSRYKQHCYWKSSSYVPSESFLRALRTYESHHKQCTDGLPLTDLALRGLAPVNCQYLVWRDLDGKGNQLVSLVSAFVYALLTNRALLITRGAQLQHLLCEPFGGSSWVLPEDFPDNQIRESAEMHGQFYERALNWSVESTNGGKAMVEVPQRLEAFTSNWQQPADLRFFCEGEQSLVRGVPWVFYRSNQYSVPGLYFVPSFRARLNVWFPDRAVFLHTGRYLLSPQNEIWDTIMNKYRSHMAASDRRLAIQVRAWSNAYTPVISEHILACAVYAGVLPNVISNSQSKSNGTILPSTSVGPALDPKEQVSVVLSSLKKEYAEKLAEAFNQSVSMAGIGSGVSIFSPSTEGEQQTGQLLHERTVIADMWLLSFADDIISSPKSTFGYVSHGLAGMKPIVFNQYGINKEEVPNPPCWRTNLPGPCFIDHPHNMECPLDHPASYIGDAHSDLPEVRPCELQWGIGLFEEVSTDQ